MGNNFKETLYQMVSDLIDYVGGRNQVVLLGVFNPWTGKRINDNIVGKYGDDKVNDSGERLIDFFE